MKRSILNVLAAIGVAFALSGCIIVPFHHHDGGYNNGGYYQGGGGYNHNGY